MEGPKVQDRNRGCRISVRLDPQRADLLRKLSGRRGCDSSHVLRQALDRLGASLSQGIGATGAGANGAPTESQASPGPAPNSTGPTLATPPQAAPPADVRPPQPPVLSTARIPAHPEKIAELIRQSRALGAATWPERRRLFQRLFAVAEVALEYGQNPQDVALHAELLRLGHAFGLFN
jgi:hypothetical protein